MSLDEDCGISLLAVVEMQDFSEKIWKLKRNQRVFFIDIPRRVTAKERKQNVIFVEKRRGLKNNAYICGRITDERYE